jgi:hypothetical protein
MDRHPKRGQRLLFSATLDNGVDKLVAATSATRSPSVDETRTRPSPR